MWSDAELALGKITNNYSSDEKGAREFFECHGDICESLSNYLKKEELKIDNDKIDAVRSALIDLMNKYDYGFRLDRSSLIRNALSYYPGETNYNFLIFNYTEIIDKCFKDHNLINERLKKRTYRGNDFNSYISNIVHVHGTTAEDMIFGVNDESQIDNMEMFNNSNALYRQEFIKQSCNKNNGKDIDTLAKGIIATSNIVYLYGMSIGDTDALWWERICDLLVSNPNSQIIVYKYPVPVRGVNNFSFLFAEDDLRNRIVSFGKIPSNYLDNVKSRIHIDEYDKLINARDIADEEDVKRREKLMEIAKEVVKKKD